MSLLIDANMIIFMGQDTMDAWYRLITKSCETNSIGYGIKYICEIGNINTYYLCLWWNTKNYTTKKEENIGNKISADMVHACKQVSTFFNNKYLSHIVSLF